MGTLFMYIEMLWDAPFQLVGIHQWESEVFLTEAQQCSRKGKPVNFTAHFTCADRVACRDKGWVNYAEFTGGTMDFWQSPEVMRLGSSYETFHNGMWKHRWGDQQFWRPIM